MDPSEDDFILHNPDSSPLYEDRFTIDGYFDMILHGNPVDIFLDLQSMKWQADFYSASTASPHNVPWCNTKRIRLKELLAWAHSAGERESDGSTIETMPPEFYCLISTQDNGCLDMPSSHDQLDHLWTVIRSFCTPAVFDNSPASLMACMVHELVETLFRCTTTVHKASAKVTANLHTQQLAAMQRMIPVVQIANCSISNMEDEDNASQQARICSKRQHSSDSGSDSTITIDDASSTDDAGFTTRISKKARRRAARSRPTSPQLNSNPKPLSYAACVKTPDTKSAIQKRLPTPKIKQPKSKFTVIVTVKTINDASGSSVSKDELFRREKLVSAALRKLDVQQYNPIDVRAIRGGFAIDLPNACQLDYVTKAVSDDTISARPATAYKPELLIQDVADALDNEDILESIYADNISVQSKCKSLIEWKEQFKIVARRKIGNSSRFVNLIIRTSEEISESLLANDGKIRIRYQVVNLRRHIEPLQCTNCWNFGHTKTKCLDKESTCSKCASKGHSHGNCPSAKLPSKCVNCIRHGSSANEISHRSFADRCPRYIRETEFTRRYYYNAI